MLAFVRCLLSLVGIISNISLHLQTDIDKFAKSCAQQVRLSLILIAFSLTVKAATVIFISGRGSAISSAKQGKSGSVYNLVKNK